MKKFFYFLFFLTFLSSCDNDNQDLYIQKVSQEELENTGCWYHEYDDIIIKFKDGKIKYFADYKTAGEYEYSMFQDTIVVKAWGLGELKDYKLTVDIVHWFGKKQLRILGDEIPYWLRSGYYDNLGVDIWD